MILIYLQLILMVLLWSFSFVAVDISVAYISPLSLALIRFVFASISFLIIDLIKYIKSKNKSNPYNDKKKMDHGILSNFSTNQWILLIIASFSGISIFFFTQYTAIQMIGPSFPALVVCLLAPVLISIFAIFIFGEKLKTIKVIGYIIASVGAFLLITGGNLSVLNPDSVNFLGYLFALLTPILWSVYSTLTKKLTLSESTLLITKYISYLGSIELLIFVIINGDFLNFIFNIENPIVLISAFYLGVCCYVIGYYIWNNSQKKIKSSKVSSFLYIEPFLTLLFSFLLQRAEIITFLNILGGLIVLSAVLIINYK